jgi:hypothetical protein
MAFHDIVLYDFVIDANSQMALDAVLDRSEKVLTSYIQEEKLMGNCPPSRSSMNEVSLVLKSLRALITSLKQQEKTTTGMYVWMFVTNMMNYWNICNSSIITVE